LTLEGGEEAAARTTERRTIERKTENQERRTKNVLLYQSMATSRRAVLKTLLAGGIGAVTGGITYSYLYDRRSLEVTRLPIPVEGLAPDLAGLRIGLLTDVHLSRWVSQEEVAAAVSVLMREQPDLIVLGGDYVTWGGDRDKRGDRGFVGPSAEVLGALSAPHGVYGILGNHDDDHDMPAALAARGVHVLKDARTRLKIRNEHIELAGLRFWTKKAADIATLLRGAQGTVFLLAHDPRRFAEAQALNVPLVLSGHTHGGQIVLPLAGPIAAKEFPVIAGAARHNRTSIFVSRGIGTVYVPVRVNCPPEVAVLTLQPVTV
jgi:predicted MPP superfamily phosphohydrolase